MPDRFKVHARAIEEAMARIREFNSHPFKDLDWSLRQFGINSLPSPPQESVEIPSKVPEQARPGKGGRRLGKVVDGEKLRRLRDSTSLGTFARMCDVSVDTVQRAEKSGRASDTTIAKLLKGVRLKGHGELKSRDLVKNTPQKRRKN